MFTESPWGPPMALPMWWLADFLQFPQWSFLSTTKETRMRTSRMIGTVIPTWVDNSCLIQSMQLDFIRCIKFIVCLWCKIKKVKKN